MPQMPQMQQNEIGKVRQARSVELSLAGSNNTSKHQTPQPIHIGNIQTQAQTQAQMQGQRNEMNLNQNENENENQRQSNQYQGRGQSIPAIIIAPNQLNQLNQMGMPQFLVNEINGMILMQSLNIEAC